MHRKSEAASEHRLRLGLPGSLIRFAPLAFVPQRQLCARYSPSPLVFLPISTDFTPTPAVPVPPRTLNPDSIAPISRVKPEYLKCDLSRRLRTLYAQ